MRTKEIDGLNISADLYEFLSFEILAGTGVGAHQFWTGFAKIVEDLAPRLRELLGTRARLQGEIDQYHLSRAGQPHDAAAYEAHLRKIGYLADPPAAFTINPSKLDDAMRTAAPQFVVPGLNPRSLTRAINARWSSLYDALYGSDAIPEDKGAERDQTYNKVRGAIVVERGRDFLDQVIPLAKGSHHTATAYVIEAGAFVATIEGGEKTGLKDPAQFAAYQGRPPAPTSILLRDKGLYIELKIDRKTPVGKEDRAGIADIILEAAVTTIVDFEDTTVAVDIGDKINLYRNWLSVVKGSLRCQFKKNNRVVDRLFSADYRYQLPGGKSSMAVAGRGLAMARVAGPHRLTDLILDAGGQPVPEVMLDAAVAALAGLHDTRRSKPPYNSEAGSIYIIVPKLHGPEETALMDDLFTRVEDVLDLPKNVVKIGLANDTARTSLNLAASIHPLAERIAWLGTSRFERARDEIETAMEAGPVGGASELLGAAWIKAYETVDIETALACGFGGMGQIAVGEWTPAEDMRRLLTEKAEDVQLGASSTRVSSPRAAALTAMLYHQTDVAQKQKALAAWPGADAMRAHVLEQLGSPVRQVPLAAEDLTRELETHCHRILAYIVHCIDRGAGISRLRDAQDKVFIEDRSALRFSSLSIANWLHHKIISREEAVDALRRMAEKVDQQNSGNAAYTPMSPGFDSSAFNAAAELIFIKRGASESDIDTIIAMRRREVKAGQLPEVSNRFQSLKGAMGRLESGEAFFGVSD